MGLFSGLPGGVTIQAVTHHQDEPVGPARLLQQFTTLFDGRPQIASLHWHQRGIEGRQLGMDGFHVVGKGHHGEGSPGKGDEGGLSLTPLPEDILHLETGADQTRGPDILGIHGARQVEQDHQGRPAAVDRLGQLFPGRSRLGENGQHETQGHQRQRPTPGAALLQQKVRQ